MSEERAIPLSDWPQPDGGAPMPDVYADDTSLFVTYVTEGGKHAVVHFPLCSVFTFGSPNDEALSGHPLYGKGLQFYSVHRVEHSSWIALLERRNSVHPSHDRQRFLEDKRHYVFTFHDSTLECVVSEGQWWKPDVQEFASATEAHAHVVRKKKGEPDGAIDECRSCGAAIGELHDPFCNRELCPFCRDFISTCDCIFRVLNLSPEEREVVEAYEDDSTEPLRSICDRWSAAVEAKGRIPHNSRP